MRAPARTCLLALALLGAAATPSDAADAVVLTCAVGASSGYCTATGTRNGPVYLSLTSTTSAPPCPTGTKSGTMSGAINGTFVVTRVGATTVITTNGDIDGGGVGTAYPTCTGGSAYSMYFVISGT